MIRNSEVQITPDECKSIAIRRSLLLGEFLQISPSVRLVTPSLAAQFGSTVLVDEGLFSFRHRSGASGFPPGLPISPDGGDHLV
jgi:hypothetical protein